MRLRNSFAILAFACLTTACADGPVDEGFVGVDGGRIWYAKMGNGSGTPLIVVHGGPGSGSCGLRVWEALGDERVVVRYDQLGAGKADHPTDTTLFTVERAVRELQALRDSLGLTTVHLYGRSWGAMLVEAYMGTNPTGVRSVILSSPLVTTAQWEADADSLIKTLPDESQSAISRHEAAGTTDSPEYKAAMDAYYGRYVRRRPRLSLPGTDCGSSGALVYGYMWGPSEFTATGTLKTFDATPWLAGIKVPTLFVTGEFDEAFRLLDHLFAVPSNLTVPMLKLDPGWDPLRKDPRYQGLIDKYSPKS